MLFRSKDIEQIIRRFLWSGGVEKTYGSKVAWHRVCLPKKEGGLGIKPLVEMNSVHNLKHIWNLLSPTNCSHWKKWIQTSMLKGNSFWIVKPPAQYSWYWRKLLKLRDIAKPLVKYKIGNGIDTSLWHDPWLPFGSIFEKYGSSVMYYTAIPLSSKVQAIIAWNEWAWPITSSWERIEIKAATALLPSPSHNKDVVSWIPSLSGTFITSHTWDFLRASSPKVPWYHLVWFFGNIPRFSFIVWLAILNKLYTQDRIWKFTPRPLACVLCHKALESHDHLFFTCDYSSFIWQEIMSRFTMDGSPLDWSSIILWAASKWKSKKPKDIMPRMCFGATIYAIWRERNARVFRQEGKPRERTSRDILIYIHTQIQVTWARDPKVQDYLDLCN